MVTNNDSISEQIKGAADPAAPALCLFIIREDTFMISILVIEAEYNARRFYQRILSHAGYQVHPATCCKTALATLESVPVSLILLGDLLTGSAPLTFIQTLRECRNELPILMISRNRSLTDIKKAILLGADDYMIKPADEEELFLRIHALLRRSKIISARSLTVGQTFLSYDTLTVTTGKYTETLPQKEFYLLYKLLSYPNQIFTRVQLMDAIWGPGSASCEATVSVHINRLRKRYRTCCDFSILTVRGLGYKAVIRH